MNREKIRKLLLGLLFVLLAFGCIRMTGTIGRQAPENPMEEAKASPSRLILSDGQILLDSGKIADMMSANLTEDQSGSKDGTNADGEGDESSSGQASEDRQEDTGEEQQEQQQEPEGLSDLLAVSDNVQKIEDLGLIPDAGSGSQWAGRFSAVDVPDSSGTGDNTGGGDNSGTGDNTGGDNNQGNTDNTGGGEDSGKGDTPGPDDSDTAQLAIVTNLTDGQWTAPEITFQAYGTYGDQKLGAAVRVNGAYISGNGDSFTASLQPGENKIQILVSHGQETKKVIYTIVYTETEFQVRTTISDTVLYGTEAEGASENAVYTGDSEDYRFQVAISRITGKEQIAEVRVYDTGNGTVLALQGDGCYHLTLDARSRTRVRLKYLDSNGDAHTYYYYIAYERTYTPPDKYPVIQALVEVNDTRINLEDGMTFRSPSVIVDVNATSYRGEQLYYNEYTVNLNGYTYPQHDYQTGSWFGYDCTLQPGENILTIQVKDKEKYTVTRTYRLYYEEGDVTVTVSVEAGTVGIPYLVEPTQVTVPGGTNLASIVINLLNENGYKAYGNGTADSGFYLSGVEKEGLLSRVHIPDDLLERMLEDDIQVSNTTGDWLGEFDFTVYSGWMYSVNGHYPGYSMSNNKPQDGAVIRVRYTLAFGKDIGGYVSVGYPCGNTNTNYEKEW